MSSLISPFDLQTITMNGEKKNIKLPEIPPYYLIIMITMIIRDYTADNIKRYIQEDELLGRVLFKEDKREYNFFLIFILANILQSKYGINFTNYGIFYKHVVELIKKDTEEKDTGGDAGGDAGIGIDTITPTFPSISNDDKIKSLSLIWHYSPTTTTNGDVISLNLF